MNHDTPGILLHPGGGGAQYPLRFKPFRPRNLWRRTPGPRPPRGPANTRAFIVGSLAVIVIAAVILVGTASDWFGLTDSKSSSVLSVDQAETAGFVIERNLVDRNVRVLNGTFEGVSASIAIPERGQVISSNRPEVQRAAQWLQLGGNWQALKVGSALVLCEPVPECSNLAAALIEVVFDS